MIMEMNEIKAKPFEQLNFSPTILRGCKDIDLFTNNSPEDLWKYFYNKYSMRTPIELYQIEDYFKFSIEVLFLANNYKYKRLLDTLVNYDVLSPYNIKEEYVKGSRIGNTKQKPNTVTSLENKETSFDNLSPKLTSTSSETVTGENITEINHSVSETYDTDNKTLVNLASSDKKLISRKGNIGNHTNSDLIEKERQVANFALWDIICMDIIEHTCYKFIV